MNTDTRCINLFTEEEHRIELEQRQRDLMPPAAGRESIESLERQISECEQDLLRQVC